MFPDEPFAPEKVEKQIADLNDSLQKNFTQRQTRNPRLINDLQQLAQTYRADSAVLERAHQRLVNHLNEKAELANWNDNLVSTPSKKLQLRKNVNPSHRKLSWSPRLIAALLLVGILLVGTFVFAFSRLLSSTTVQKTPPAKAPNNSAALSISIEPQPFLYQNDLYVNSGSDIRTYAIQNGVPGRIYALADVGTPTIINGVLYASGLTSTSAMQISDGKLLWQAPFGSGTTNPPLIVNNVLYGYTPIPNKIFYALRVSDGKVLWQYRLSNQNEFPNAPLVVQGIVYFSSYIQLNQSIDARVYALKATDGSLIWYRSLGQRMISSLKTDGSTLYVFVDGSIEALQAHSGNIIWRSSLPLSSQLEMSNTTIGAMFNGIIYIAGGDGTIYALRTADGTLLWHYQTSPGTQFGLFITQGNTLYVGILAISTPNPHSIRSSFLLALRTNNGHLRWQTHLSMQEILNPVAGQGVIYVVYGTGNNGQQVLSALLAINGTTLWNRMLPASFS
jgi:outer membrane protein assembly factor BamB